MYLLRYDLLFEGGVRQSLEEIIATARSYNTPYICVTGGEPLAQPNCLVLLQRLCDLGHKVSLETSGALDVSKVDPRVSKVLDLKLQILEKLHVT